MKQFRIPRGWNSYCSRELGCVPMLKIPYKTRVVFRKLLGKSYLDCRLYKRFHAKNRDCSGQIPHNQDYIHVCPVCPMYNSNDTLWSENTI